MQRLRQSPTDPGFVQNPYPFYARAREAGDLVWWEEYGLAVATTHRAVSALLRDPRLGREPPAGIRPDPPPHLAPFQAVEDHSMLELERPRHTRLRGLVLRAFTSRRISGLAPEIEALAHRLIDTFPAGPFDLLDAYARPLPVIVIARLLGVPEQMAPQLLRWSNAMVAMYQARRGRAEEEAAAGAAQDFSVFLRSHIEARRNRPADDLITHLIAAEADGGRLSTEEMISTCILLLNAGHEATVHTIGNGVRALLEHGPARDALSGTAIEATIEEILRFDPPLHLFTRWVYEPVETFGHRLEPGREVGLLLASAGRDGTRFSHPDRFDPFRAATDHLAFGAGPHFCLGAPLARMELRIALAALFSRRPGLTLAGRPAFADIYHFHGLRRLNVVAHPAV